MKPPATYQRPYPEPEPRTFAQWRIDLGISCEGLCPDEGIIFTYDSFFDLPNVRLTKTSNTELYGFWRQYGNVWSESRTVQEWLTDFDWEIVEPTEEDLQDLHLILAYDEFHNWSGGKVTAKEKENKGWWSKLKRLFKIH